MHFVQQRQYLPISVSLSCNQTKQRNTFMDIQLMPLVSKANLNECCGLLGQPFGALQSRCHRCDTGVTKTRTEVPSPKSQPGTLTTKFLFLLCSRTLWAKCTEILWYPQLARKVAKCHYRWSLLLMSKMRKIKNEKICSDQLLCQMRNSPHFHPTALCHLRWGVWYRDGENIQTIIFSKKDT